MFISKQTMRSVVKKNKVEFLEGRFLDEKLPFFHKNKLSILRLLNFLFPVFVF